MHADGLGNCPNTGKLSCIKDTFQSLLQISPDTFPDITTAGGSSMFSAFNPTFLAQMANELIDTAITAAACALPIFNGSTLKDPAFSLNQKSSGACSALPVNSGDYVVGVFNSSLAFPSDIQANGTLDKIRTTIVSAFPNSFAICMAVNPCNGLGE